MPLDVRLEDESALSAYASIPIAFEVRERLDPASTRLDGQQLRSVPVTPPYVKDYDALPLNAPSSWSTRFNLSRWTFLAAFISERRVGGEIVIAEPGELLDESVPPSYALLWDLRVAPAHRGRGVGSALLNDAVTRMRIAGAAGIAIETQDINVPACRLYAACGFAVTKVVPQAYSGLLGETKLIWTLSFDT